MTKICAECKYYKVPKQYIDLEIDAICTHPISAYPINKITGEVKYKSCYCMRADTWYYTKEDKSDLHQLCAPQAKYWNK